MSNCSKRVRQPGLGLLILCAIGLSGCNRQEKSVSHPAASSSQPAAEQSTFRFGDITTVSGVKSQYENGEAAQEYSIVESLGGGLGALDFDRDGRTDLIFPGGGIIEHDQPLRGLPTTLWRNLEQTSFEFADVTAAANVPPPSNYSHGCAIADADNDGFADVLITGYGSLQLLHNQGDGTFAVITEAAKLLDKSWSSSAAWGDFNEDGCLDLYIAHYVNWSWENNPRCPTTTPGVFDVCTPNDFDALPDEVYFSNGDGTYRAGSRESGLNQGGKGLGVAVVDVNGDSHVDIYVANDTTSNFLYLNDGSGTFQDAGLISGTALDGSGTPNGSMGIAVLDYNLDSMPDLWVTNYENETYALYENGGDARFLWATDRVGLNVLGHMFVGFGTVSGDLDLDGDEDLVVANGHVMLHPAQSRTAQQCVVLANSLVGTSRRLVRQNFDADNYLSQFHRGRGLVTCDLDRDGDLDLAFSNVREPAAVLLNETRSAGKQLSVELVGNQSNRDAIGARAVLHTDANRYVRFVVGGGSYLSQNVYTLTWGIPSGEHVTKLEITWPNRTVQTITQLSFSEPNIVRQP